MTVKEIMSYCMRTMFSALCPICGERPMAASLPLCSNCSTGLNSGTVPTVATTVRVPYIFSCRAYAGIVKECIRQFKYHGNSSMIGAFGAMIRETAAIRGLTSGSADFLIPVPIHEDRRLQRGFNQAEVISRALSGFIPVPTVTDVLMKKRNTPAQAGLTCRGRRKGPAGSFAAGNASHLIKGKTVVVVDDVMTTGATLNACASVLSRAGAAEVLGFTLARTV